MEPIGKSIGITKPMNGDDIQKRLDDILGNPRKNNVECYVKVEYEEPIYIDPKPLLERYGVQKRYQHSSFTWIKEHGIFHECDRESYRKAYQYGQNITNAIREGKGLMLRGSVGTGKTTLAISIMRKAVEQGIRCLFVNNISLNDKLLNLLNSDRKELANYDRLLRTVPLLVIDDFGAESDRNNRSWVVEKMESIIGDRYDRMLPIIITTNLTKDEIKARYNERIYDRLRDTCDLLIFRGKSLRGGNETRNA